MAEKKVAVSLDLLLNELKNFKVDSLSAAPATAAAGRVYFNTGDKTLYYGADDKWNPIATGVKSAIDGLSGSVKNHDDTIKGHTTSITSLQSNVSSLNSDVSRINKHRSKYRTVSAGTSSASITEDGYAIRNVRFFQLSGTAGSYDEIEVSVLQNGLPNAAAQSVVVSWSGISVTAAKPAFITYEVVPISA